MHLENICLQGDVEKSQDVGGSVSVVAVRVRHLISI